MNENRKKSAKPVPPDPFSLFSLSCLSALAFSSFILGPLPVLYAHARFPDPLPKAMALGGAVLAVVGLSAPVPWIAAVFTLSIVLGDLIFRTGRLVPALSISVLAASAVALGLFLLNAAQSGQAPLAFWNGLVQSWLDQMRSVVQTGVPMDWEGLDSLLRFQGPFLIVAALLVAAWVSVGAAAHWGWVSGPKPLTSKALRKRGRLPSGIVALLSVALLAGWYLPLPFYLIGAGRILACILFIQGCVCLSDILNRRGTSLLARTLVYGFAVAFGFYALLALGVISPWYFRLEERKKK